jgi:hypothetical protein
MIGGGLSEIVKRLTERGTPRSEATIQSDVRQLLLVAPFELEEEHIDAPLEVPVGASAFNIKIDLQLRYLCSSVTPFSGTFPRTCSALRC